MFATMQIKPFASLDSDERKCLFGFLTTAAAAAPFPDADVMAEAFSSPAYNGGRNLLTLWAAPGQAAGTLGVITKDAAAKGDLFLTSLHVREREAPEVVPLLVQAARRLAAETPGVPVDSVLRLGLRALSPLQAAVETVGFRPCYRVLELSRLAGDEPLPLAPLAWQPATEANLADYAAVHNAAFRLSPNGAMTSVAELRDSLAEVGSPDLLQVGYTGDVPAAVLEVSLHEGYGMIEAIGVAPDFQGRGLGEAALNQAMRTLRRHGVPELRLAVVESNRAACSLYAKRGFAERRTIAQWFVIENI